MANIVNFRIKRQALTNSGTNQSGTLNKDNEEILDLGYSPGEEIVIPIELDTFGNPPTTFTVDKRLPDVSGASLVLTGVRLKKDIDYRILDPHTIEWIRTDFDLDPRYRMWIVY